LAKTPKYSRSTSTRTKSARRKINSEATQDATPAKGSRPPLEKAAILRFITENPDTASKREIARAFGVKGDDRVILKEILRDMADEGLLGGTRKKITRPGVMPSVTTLEIKSRDNGGELIGRPTQWRDEDGNAPAVLIKQSNNGSRTGKGNNAAPTAGMGDRILARIFPSNDPEGPSYAAKVMKVLDRHKTSTMGIFRITKDDRAITNDVNSGGRVLPIDRRGKEYLIAPDHVGKAEHGDLVEVETLLTNKMGLPHAKIIDVIGSIASEKAITMIAVHERGIPHIFPEAVLTSSQEAEPATMQNSGKKREDWRDVPLITIDPATAKDHDDAVYAEMDTNPDNTGGVILYVAIADVSFYVRAGSPMDQEARIRGNSVYFPDRVIPMLPERISNDLCSLKEGVDRPALATKIIFNADGRKVSHSFHRIMMRSAASLAYEQAQRAIDGTPDAQAGEILESVLKPLWAAYAIMKKGRERRQPLDLDLPERRIILDNEGKVDHIHIPDRLDAHKLIEECMIQANVAAGEALELKRQALIYRVHDTPSLSKQETLREFLATLDIPLAKGGDLRANHFNGILAHVKGKPTETMVNEMVLRSQSQAVYSPENLGHFGLNLRKYAHFTSPIRRYADLIVHRALVGSHGLGEGGITPDEEAALEMISEDISNFERRASGAERDTQDRLIAHHLAERVGDEFQGRIAGVTKSGLFVSLPEFGADGFIPISKLGSDYYFYDEAYQALIGERTRLGFRLGDQVDVRLVEAIPLAGALRFDMLSKGETISTGTRSYHKVKKGRPTTRPQHISGRKQKRRK
jgi:ribonuclease R